MCLYVRTSFSENRDAIVMPACMPLKGSVMDCVACKSSKGAHRAIAFGSCIKRGLVYDLHLPLDVSFEYIYHPYSPERLSISFPSGMATARVRTACDSYKTTRERERMRERELPDDTTLLACLYVSTQNENEKDNLTGQTNRTIGNTSVQ